MHAAPAVDTVEGAGHDELAFVGQALDVREVAFEHRIALRAVGHALRAGLQHHEDVGAHAVLVGADRLRELGVESRLVDGLCAQGAMAGQQQCQGQRERKASVHRGLLERFESLLHPTTL
jgi:hypothetical protein